MRVKVTMEIEFNQPLDDRGSIDVGINNALQYALEDASVEGGCSLQESLELKWEIQGENYNFTIQCTDGGGWGKPGQTGYYVCKASSIEEATEEVKTHIPGGWKFKFEGMTDHQPGFRTTDGRLGENIYNHPSLEEDDL